MIVLQTIAVAFAMFSAIPVPQFDWNEKNMRYAMCAFPLIGVVIGAAWCVCGALPLPGLAKAAGFAHRQGDSVCSWRHHPPESHLRGGSRQRGRDLSL